MKVYVTETVLPGFSYQLILSNTRNAGKFDASIRKYVVEVSDEPEDFIVMSSFVTTSNYLSSAFIQDPTASYISFYDLPSINVASTIINSLNMIAGVYSDLIYFRPLVPATNNLWYARTHAMQALLDNYYLRQRSFTLSSGLSDVDISVTDVVGGTLGEKSLRIFSTTALGVRDLQVTRLLAVTSLIVLSPDSKRGRRLVLLRLECATVEVQRVELSCFESVYNNV